MPDNSDDRLVTKLDEAAKLLLDIMKTDKIEIDQETEEVRKPCEVSEKVQIFNSVVRYLAVKHKVAPEEEEAGIDEMVKQLHGDSSQRRGGRRGSQK